MSAALFALGLRLRADGTLPFYERPAVAIVLGSSAALVLVVALVALIALATRAAARRRSGAAGPDNADVSARVRRRPYATLFIISAVGLFVELMLIRYAGSQIRIFAFYKNVPLIASFLGLGLGCWLARGTARHVMLFLLWLVPLAVFLSAGSLGVSNALGKLAAAGTTEQILGDFLPDPPSLRWRAISQLSIAAFSVATLTAITLLFVQLGRLLGAAFERVARLPGYTVNIVGSLAGILAFVALGYWRTPPWIWFALGLVPLIWWVPTRTTRLAAVALMIVVVAAVFPSYGNTVWSPYQKLVGHLVPLETNTDYEPAGYLVQISDVFYQLAVDRRPKVLELTGTDPMPHYDAVWSRLPRPSRVLVVGSGTGNDVAAALRAGADRVDAVDIDPAIVEMGRQFHPEQPYSDARVRLIVDDARHAFRELPTEAFDAVVFGLLDSHTQLGMSSVRLDNYVFTAESFADARRLVRPGGHLVVTASAYRDWFRARFDSMLSQATGGPVETMQHHQWSTFIAEVAASRTAPGVGQVLTPTDDWPFLYLPRRGIPLAYLWVVGCLGLASIALLRLHGLRLGSLGTVGGRMFFLGAAFLLMEVHAINRLALLFGATWIVSAVTIAIVLTLIVAANLTTLGLGDVPYSVSYTALTASLILSWWLEPSAALGAGFVAGLSFGLAILCPVYFAGLVFARAFREAPLAAPAIGANIIGSVLGGWVEYGTMLWGVRALVVLAGVFYLLSLLMHLGARRSSAAVAVENVAPVAR